MGLSDTSIQINQEFLFD